MNVSQALGPSRWLYTPASSVPAHQGLPVSDLTSAQHAALLLPRGEKGMMVFGGWVLETKVDRTGAKETAVVYRQAGAKASEVESTVERLKPILVTMNGFRLMGTFGGDYHEWPNKRLTNLFRFRAVWVELDFYKVAAYRFSSAENMVWLVLDRIRHMMLPDPSYIVSSGRGLHVVWLTEGVPSIALPAWNALQRHLNGALSDMGADRQAAPPTANLRLIGTLNKGERVQMLHPATVGDIRRYAFRALCQHVLPYSPEQVQAHKARVVEKKEARVRVAKERVSNGASPTLTGETYWQTIEADLWRLLDLRYPADLPPHPDRDERQHGRFLFAFLRIWSWRIFDVDELKAKIREHAARLGYKPAEALSEAGTVIRRLSAVLKGKVRGHRPGTGLYKLGPKMLVAEFTVTVAEAQKANLRMLVPAALKPARVAERQAKTRLAKGATLRSTTQGARLEIGLKALEMRSQFMTRKAIAEALGQKLTYLDTAIREAKAVASISAKPKPSRKTKASVEASCEQGDSEASRGSSRFIETDQDTASVLVAVDGERYIATVHDEAPPHLNTQPVAPPEAGGLSRSGGRSPVLPEYLRRGLAKA